MGAEADAVDAVVGQDATLSASSESGLASMENSCARLEAAASDSRWSSSAFQLARR